jgi:N-acetyl-anhydromuramyl-L-alanine amidase AmpD
MGNFSARAGETNLLRGASPHERQAVCVPGFNINRSGHVESSRVTLKIRPKIERETMAAVHGIIVHQTGGSNAAGSLSSYEQEGANGAHFLIDKDGAIYQTASLYKRCNHVGNLKSRCMAEKRCTPADRKELSGQTVGKGIGRIEASKAWPDRYPGNSDSIGIEMVGKTVPATQAQKLKWGEDMVYEPLTPEQQGSLTWLVRMVATVLGLDLREVFTHPTVSWKNRSEAGTATW